MSTLACVYGGVRNHLLRHPRYQAVNDLGQWHAPRAQIPCAGLFTVLLFYVDCFFIYRVEWNKAICICGWQITGKPCQTQIIKTLHLKGKTENVIRSP